MPTSYSGTLYTWLDLSQIGDEPGVYAWYYTHYLATRDMERFVAEVEDLVTRDANAASARVREFLEHGLFAPLNERPYQATLTAPLRPMYAGTLEPSVRVSDTLVERLRADPSRIFAINAVLRKAVPRFASPIYIGMSTHVGTRVRQHKTKIQELMTARDARTLSVLDGVTGAGPDDARANSFALDVVRRGLNPARLVVAVEAMADADRIAVDAENILNRLNAPLCGRN